MNNWEVMTLPERREILNQWQEDIVEIYRQKSGRSDVLRFKSRDHLKEMNDSANRDKVRQEKPLFAGLAMVSTPKMSFVRTTGFILIVTGKLSTTCGVGTIEVRGEARDIPKDKFLLPDYRKNLLDEIADELLEKVA